MGQSSMEFTRVREIESKEDFENEIAERMAQLEESQPLKTIIKKLKMNFIPDGVEIPTGGRYTKLVSGETTKLRIVSETITEGNVGWTTEPKPIRWRKSEVMPTRVDWKPEDKAKYFWAVTVYNYETKQIEIWEITQKSIMNALKSISIDEDYGHPNGYDVKVTREGKGLDTTYSLLPSPKKALSEDVQMALSACLPDIEKLFTGDDPFADCK